VNYAISDVTVNSQVTGRLQNMKQITTKTLIKKNYKENQNNSTTTPAEAPK